MKHSRLFSITALAAALAFTACTAEVEDTGEVPNVNVEGGDMPSVDVDPANVDVQTGTDTQTVVTPDVDVTTTPTDSVR